MSHFRIKIYLMVSMTNVRHKSMSYELKKKMNDATYVCTRIIFKIKSGNYILIVIITQRIIFDTITFTIVKK